MTGADSFTMNQTLIRLSTMFIANIGHTPNEAVVGDQDQARREVEHPEAEHPCLEQRDDEQRAARPTHDLEPSHGEPLSRRRG